MGGGRESRPGSLRSLKPVADRRLSLRSCVCVFRLKTLKSHVFGVCARRAILHAVPRFREVRVARVRFDEDGTREESEIRRKRLVRENTCALTVVSSPRTLFRDDRNDTRASSGPAVFRIRFSADVVEASPMRTKSVALTTAVRTDRV